MSKYGGFKYNKIGKKEKEMLLIPDENGRVSRGSIISWHNEGPEAGIQLTPGQLS